MSKYKIESSILLSVMERLGLDKEDYEYSRDVIQAINSALVALSQAGVGPFEGYRIIDEKNLWEELTDNDPLLECAKDFIYLRVRLIFDPPAAGTLEAHNKVADEYLWRCRMTVEQLSTT